MAACQESAPSPRLRRLRSVGILPMTSCIGTASFPSFEPGQQLLGKRPCDVAPDADHEDPVSCLGNAVVLRMDEKVLRFCILVPRVHSRARGKGVEPVPSRTVPPLQLAHQLREDPLTGVSRGEQSLDVLQDRDRGPELGEDADVLLVERLAAILIRVVPHVPRVPGSAHHRIRLAGRPSEENRPPTVFRADGSDSLPEETAGRSSAEFHAPGFVPSLGPVLGVERSPVGFSVSLAVQEVVVLAREHCLELPKERTQPQRSMCGTLHLDRHRDTVVGATVLAVECRESLGESPRTREQIDNRDSSGHERLLGKMAPDRSSSGRQLDRMAAGFPPER